MGKPMIRFYIFTQTTIAIAAMAMLIAEILLFVVSPTYARIACEASPPHHGYYAWREVDGRRCFTSTRGMNKATLYWPPAEAQAADAVPVPAYLPPPYRCRCAACRSPSGGRDDQRSPQ